MQRCITIYTFDWNKKDSKDIATISIAVANGDSSTAKELEMSLSKPTLGRCRTSTQSKNSSRFFK